MARIEVGPNTSVGMFRLVFGFCAKQWTRQLRLIPAMAAAMLLATVCDATIPVFVGRLIDALGGSQPSVEAALLFILVILSLALGVAAFRYVGFRLLNRSTTQIMPRIADEAFGRVQHFSTDWHTSNFTGSTVRNITRGMWAYDLLADTLVIGFFPASVMLASVTVLLMLRWPVMGLIVAAGVSLFVFVAGVFVLRYIVPAARLANEADSRLGATLTDAISCNSVAKAFVGEEREAQRLHEATSDFGRLTFRTWMRTLVAGTTQTSMTAMLQAIMAGLAVWLWVKGRATAGDVAYVLATFALIQGYLRDMSTHFRNLQKTVNEMTEVAALMQQPLGVTDAPNANELVCTDGEVEFENVTFRYARGAPVLYDGLSVRIAPGEHVGLVGPSGGGKSTFVKLLLRLYDIDGGRILIDGQDIAQVTQASLRKTIASVPQEPILFHRSLADNIAYGRPNASLNDIIAAAKKAHAHEFIARLPQGYDTLAGERGVLLSGGERQRIALARAVLSDAKILVFDEATSSLDSVSEALLQDALATVMKGRTTFFIAHRLSTAQSMDRILVIASGRIVEQGTHAELINQPDGHYRHLFSVQAAGLSDRRETAFSCSTTAG